MRQKNNYQLILLTPGKEPLYDSLRNINREYWVFFKTFHLRPLPTHLFLCFVALDIKGSSDNCRDAKYRWESGIDLFFNVLFSIIRFNSNLIKFCLR